MSLSTHPLSYCTNVHPGRSLDEVLAGLERYTLGIRAQFGQPLAAGLWLAHPVIRELEGDHAALPRLSGWLCEHDISCHTLNAFPYGDFHSDRVKEQVYIPDWTTAERLSYTQNCARMLTQMLPAGGEGSISTLPLGFKALANSPKFLDRCIEHLIDAAQFLGREHELSGKIVRLAIEPEPLCVLETTAETVQFFRKLRDAADSRNARQLVETYIGVCYDVCHQAVEFEDVATSIRQLSQEKIRINKAHISCAIHADNPADLDVRTALAHYIEPRYLHQTFARTLTGEIVFETDLNADLTTNPPEAFRKAPAWRVHFHVPVDADELGPLRTTRPELIEALAAVSQLDYAPHLEVETYTWGVLPGAERPDLVNGIARELIATQRLLATN